MKKRDFSVCHEVWDKCGKMWPSSVQIFYCRDAFLRCRCHTFLNMLFPPCSFLCSCPGLLWHHGCWVCGWRRLPLHHVPIWWCHQRGRPQAVFWSVRGGGSWFLKGSTNVYFSPFFFLSVLILCVCVFCSPCCSILPWETVLWWDWRTVWRALSPWLCVYSKTVSHERCVELHNNPNVCWCFMCVFRFAEEWRWSCKRDCEAGEREHRTGGCLQESYFCPRAAEDALRKDPPLLSIQPGQRQTLQGTTPLLSSLCPNSFLERWSWILQE